MVEPKWIAEIKNPRALLVVAHPDDETIFAGGLILTSRDTQWTIICCKYEEEPRQNEFRQACNFLVKNSGNQIESIVVSKELNRRKIIDELKKHEVSKYDIVFTHNYMGEYGNEDHKYILRRVIETINHPNTWLFISPGSWNVNQEVLKSRHPRGNERKKYPLNILNLKKRALAFHESQLESNLKFNPVTGTFSEGDLQPTLQYNFEDPGVEEFTFFDKENYDKSI